MTSQKFKRLMTHKVSIIKRERTLTGDFENTTIACLVPAFVEYGVELKTYKDKEEVTANTIIYLTPTAPISSEHPYWLISQTHPYGRQVMEVLQILPIDDPRTGKTHHYEVLAR